MLQNGILCSLNTLVNYCTHLRKRTCGRTSFARTTIQPNVQTHNYLAAVHAKKLAMRTFLHHATRIFIGRHAMESDGILNGTQSFLKPLDKPWNTQPLAICSDIGSVRISTGGNVEAWSFLVHVHTHHVMSVAFQFNNTFYNF